MGWPEDVEPIFGSPEHDVQHDDHLFVRENRINSAENPKKVLDKLHAQFGHPPDWKLKAFLRAAGTSEPIVSDYNSKHCEFCNLHKLAPPHPIASIPLTVEFRYAVVYDAFEFCGWDLVFFLDYAEQYAFAVFILDAMDPGALFAALQLHVLQPFGPIKVLKMDPFTSP